MSALQKNKSTRTSGSVIAERIEKTKKSKFDLELIKIVDCFLGGHGNYDSKLVSYKKSLRNKQKFLSQLVRVISVPKKYKMLVKDEISNQKKLSLGRFLKKNFTTCQTSNRVFYNASIFNTKISHCVRFQIKNSTICQIVFNFF